MTMTTTRQPIDEYLRFCWQLLNGQRVASERALSDRRRRDVAPYIDVNRALRILDLGNGELRPQYVILRAQGHEVFGIDRLNCPSYGWAQTAYRYARLIYGLRVGCFHGIWTNDRLVCGNVQALPFESSSFDLATSVAAFEHFLDVPAVLCELHRVMKPGAIIWLDIHLFASLSGGHNLSSTNIPLTSVPANIEPWDHLRRRHLPFRVALNEWRKDRYLDEVSRHFQILTHYCALREGEDLLTPQIEAELASYDRDELTARGYTIVARKTA